MASMPAKTVRLSELEESDRTAYFSVAALMERGRAVASRSQPPVPVPVPAPATAAESAPPLAAPLAPEGPPLAYVPPTTAPTPKAGIVQQFRDASLARQATVIMLPLLIGMLALKPVFKKPKAATPAPTTLAAAPGSAAAPALSAAREGREAERPPLLAETPPEPPPAVPRGIPLERAAADALAGGDFHRALGFYRELSRRQPDNAAYHEATRILERRSKEKRP